jgi:hypothetical protein
MLLISTKLGWPLLALLAVYAVSGDDTGSAELRASAKVDAERTIMERIATAGPTIENRLRQWLTTREGLLYLREPPDTFEPYGLHVLPASTPWRASCGEMGLTVTVGNFRKDMTEIALDERQCDDLLSVLARAMRSLTAADDATRATTQRKENP